MLAFGLATTLKPQSDAAVTAKAGAAATGTRVAPATAAIVAKLRASPKDLMRSPFLAVTPRASSNERHVIGSAFQPDR